MNEPVRELVGFGRALRAEGLAVGPGRLRDFCRASALAGPEHLYWAGRTTLVAHPAEIPVYDAVFRAWFESRRAAPLERPQVTVRVDAAAGLGARASWAEVLRTKSFASLSGEELGKLAELAALIGLVVPERRTRRREGARRGAPDLRRTIRRSFRTAGEPLVLPRRRRRTRPRRLILLLDVSRSMTAYSHALVVIAHAALRADPRWEAFCFGTRLTRVTRALAGSDPNAALERAAAEVLDWDGGTRIGDSVKAFLDRYGHAGLARGAVVVICSDGLEVGEPDVLAEQMERLSRLAHRVVWLNPLMESDAYEPRARGMQAALPFIDRLGGGHNLDAVVEALCR
jgi:uncharacterized protein with von Willebrand factor type A (vWA) domain